MAPKKKIVKKTRSTEDLLQQTNELLKTQLILHLATIGTPHQTIRKIVGVDMKYVTRILKPLKGKISKND